MTNKYLLNSAVSIFFILAHLHNFSNKGYVVVLSIFLLTSYLVNKNLITSIWHIFLTILPFVRGRYFLAFVVEKDFWGGNLPISIEYLIKYSDLLILGLIGLFIRSRLMSSKNLMSMKQLPKKELALLSLFLISSAFSTLNATFTAYAFYQYFTFFILAMVFFVSILIHKYTNDNKLTISILLIHSCFICLLIILQFRKGSQLGIQLEQVADYSPNGAIQAEAKKIYRPGGYFFDPNAAGMWILISIPLIVLKIEEKSREFYPTLFYLVVLMLFLTGLIITSSRFIWIVCGLLSIVYLLQQSYRELFKQLVRIHKKVFILCSCFFVLFLPFVITRLSHFSYTFQEGGGIDYRLSHYKLAFDFILNYPLGIGLGMFKYEILGNFAPILFANDPTHPHNILVEVAVGSGIIGVILFSLFLISSFQRQFFNWRRTNDPFLFAVFLSCLCYIVAAQAYPYLLRSPIAEFFWIMMGISIVNNMKIQKNEKNY